MREQSRVVRLAAARTLDDGTPLIVAPTGEVTADVRALIDEWVRQDPRRRRARWFNDCAKPLEWEYDGRRYRPTQIVSAILAEAAGLTRSVRGPAWWRLADGRDLPSVAGSLQKSAFDWTDLHTLLAALPRGAWPTYGDVAAAIGTAPQPLGQHIMNCEQCQNVQRVLGAEGRPSPGFTWPDASRTETQQESLESEGITFVLGLADAARRLAKERLEALLQG